jgi:hypothetical protein
LSVLRASTRALRASRCSRSQRSSEFIWSRVPYLSLARSPNSCRRQIKPKRHRSGEAWTRKKREGKNRET